MAGRTHQDAFMEDGEDTCPLCVEEFDLSDKNFRPCPCGYQICQFCYNNIKNNMNGLCPACRRPYDEKSIEWKIISPEEFKADVASQARKKAAARQKEAERKQVETQNRKHLQGLRVVQRNLVYITGMSSEGVPDDQLEEQLKGPSVFGQYGKIIKLSANKLKDTGSGHALAIFITFADEESAGKCIAALDGKAHQGRILKAQHGTTKYCSAFLRNEICNNRNCTFLHEAGEDRDSFSRQELSSLNAASSQARPTNTSSASSSRPNPPQQTHSHHTGPSNTSLAAHRSEAMSRSNSGDGPALPSSANWAKNPQLQQSRRSSQAASRATPSPQVVAAKMVTVRSDSRTSSKAATSASSAGKEREVSQEDDLGVPVVEQEKHDRSVQPKREVQDQPSPAYLMLKKLVDDLFKSPISWSLDRTNLDEETLRTIDTLPSLIDPNGGAARAALRQRQEKQRQRQEQGRSSIPTVPVQDDDDNRVSGSLQLGGEPDVSEEALESARNRSIGAAIFSHQAFDTSSANTPSFTQSSLTNDFSSIDNVGRSITPQQRGGVSLLKSAQENDPILQQFQRTPNTSLHHSTLSNPFQGQNPVLSGHSRHGRQSSRFTFANDSASATAAVKPTANPQMLAQQSAMMPTQNKPYPQPNMQTGFYSGVQGPPPGLKSSGTPPISGGGMFGQGHGFANAMGGSLSFGGSHLSGKNNENEAMLMRSRAGTGGGLGPDTGKQLAGSNPAYDPLDLLRHGSPRMAVPKPRSKPEGRQSNNLPDKAFVPPGLGAPEEFPPLAAPKPAQEAVPTDTRPAANIKAASASRIQSDASAVKDAKPPIPLGQNLSQGKILEKVPETKNQAPSTDRDLMAEESSKVEEVSAKSAQLHTDVIPSHSPDKKQRGKSKAAKKPSKDEAGLDISSSEATTQPSERRQKPGKLDIAAAQDAAKGQFKQGTRKTKEGDSKSDDKTVMTTVSDSVPQSAEPGIVSGTPSSAAPAGIRVPRTLRVIDTPKLDTQTKTGTANSLAGAKDSANVASTAPETPASASAQGGPTMSRRPSLTSINMPSTPSNELYSETASYTESRPPSPSGSKGPTALSSRHKSKSQAKKERKAKKQEESKLNESMSVSVDLPAEPEVVQEAIVGRKKKAKKAKPTATMSRSEKKSDGDNGSDTKAEEAEESDVKDVAPERNVDTVNAAHELPVDEQPAPASVQVSPPETPVETEQPQQQLSPSTIPSVKERFDQINFSDLLASMISSREIEPKVVDLVTSLQSWKTPSVVTSTQTGAITQPLLPTTIDPLTAQQLATLGVGKPVVVRSVTDLFALPDLNEDDSEASSDGKQKKPKQHPYPYSIILPNAARTVLPMATLDEAELYLRLYTSTATQSPFYDELPVEGLSAKGAGAAKANPLGIDFNASQKQHRRPDNGHSHRYGLSGLSSLWTLFPEYAELRDSQRNLGLPLSAAFSDWTSPDPSAKAADPATGDGAASSPSSASATAAAAERAATDALICNDPAARRWMDENAREIEEAEAAAGGSHFARLRAAQLGSGPLRLDAGAVLPVPASAAPAAMGPGGVPPAEHAIRGIGQAAPSRQPAALGPGKLHDEDADRDDAEAAEPAPLRNRTVAEQVAAASPARKPSAEIEARLAASEDFVALCRRELEAVERRDATLAKRSQRLLRRSPAAKV